MKKKWVLAALLLSIVASAISAAAHGGRGGGKHRVSLTEELGLSEEQQGQWTELNTTFREQKQALREEYRTAFDAILTDEQREKLDEIKAGFSHGKDKAEDTEGEESQEESADTQTVEAAIQVAPAVATAPTAVEETSWGKIKDSFSK